MAETFTQDVDDGTQTELKDIAELDTCVTVVDAGSTPCFSGYAKNEACVLWRAVLKRVF